MAAISLQQAIIYAQAAGFVTDPYTICAIACAESGLDPLATNTNSDSHTFPDGHTGPTTDRGILQINNYWQPYPDAVCFDPAQAFKAGWTISKQGTDYTPWSTYNSGAYKRFLPMSITRMLPNAVHFSEFQGGYHGTCGETALATAMVCSTPQIESQQDAINLMLSMTKELIGLGWADASGATTTQHLHDEAIRRGFHPDETGFVPFHQPLDQTTLHNELLQYAGVKPIILEVATAGKGLPGDEAGVQYHFICVVGINPNGYVVNDGDNSASPQMLVTYSWDDIWNATPCGNLVLEMETAPAMAWTQTSTGAKDSLGHIVGQGLAAAIFSNNLQGSDGLMSETYYNSKNSFVPLSNGTVVSWDGAAHDNQAAQVLVAVFGEVSGLNNQIASLNAEIAQLKSQPVAVPIDPSVKNALSAALQLLQPNVTVAGDVQKALSTLS